MTLKIGIVCHPTYGGSGVVASELALTLAELGHRCTSSRTRCRRASRARPNPSRCTVAQGVPYPLFDSPPHDLAITSRSSTCTARGPRRRARALRDPARVSRVRRAQRARKRTAATPRRAS
jgi:hypothetical protein